MSGTEPSGATWTDEDTDDLFATLGRYWFFFQWIESQLDQALLLTWGVESWDASHARLARMTNEQKVDAVREAVLTYPCFSKVRTRPEWLTQFETLIRQLHDERRRRNSIIHSQILFDLADRGLAPPLLSIRMRGSTESQFDQRCLTAEFQKELLDRILELAMSMGFALGQLRRDHELPPDQM